MRISTKALALRQLILHLIAKGFIVTEEQRDKETKRYARMTIAQLDKERKYWLAK
jgi:ribosomal protein L17